jgi:2-polyprenyl-3-methyl-5-hydroxy-6-metoxy-1,4-benzoquinol methylase
MTWRFSKDCYEPAQLDLVAAIPQAARNVLSIGCGSGATEAALTKKGLRVVAVPADTVFAGCARANGVEVVDWDGATARTKLDGEQFDCLLLVDVLHLIQDPRAAVSTFAPLLRAGATVIARVPRVSRLTTAYRVIRGDQKIKEMRNKVKRLVTSTKRSSIPPKDL